MSTAIYCRDGYRTKITPQVALLCGEVVVVGKIVGVVTAPLAAGETGEIQVGGVYRLGVTGQTIELGDIVKISAKDPATGSSVTVPFGRALEAVDSTATEVCAKLEQLYGITLTPKKLAAPTITATAASATSATLSGMTNANATSWQYRQASSEAGLASETATDATPTSGSATISSLTASTAYYWQVKAVGDGIDYSDSDWSAAVTATTPAS